jgi:hypothetical protein
MKFWLVLFMNKYKRLVNEYAYHGFRPLSKVEVHPDIPDARIITLRRRQKKAYVAAAVKHTMPIMIRKQGLSVIFPVEMPGFILKLRYAGLSARFAAK